MNPDLYQGIGAAVVKKGATPQWTHSNVSHPELKHVGSAFLEGEFDEDFSLDLLNFKD
jgi:hypothetical protein